MRRAGRQNTYKRKKKTPHKTKLTSKQLQRPYQVHFVGWLLPCSMSKLHAKYTPGTGLLKQFHKLPLFFFFCIWCDDRAKSSGQWLLVKSTIRCSSAACPQSLVPTSVSSGQNCWRTVSRCGQVWIMCSGVCSSEPHSQWAESARPNLSRCFLSPQWPVQATTPRKTIADQTCYPTQSQ